MRHIALMISKQAQEEQASYYYHLCAPISTRQKSDESPITPLHSSSLSPNPPFQCSGFVASKHEGCASRVVRGVCSGLWVAGCRRCPSGSGTRCSAERGSGPDGWHRNKKTLTKPKTKQQIDTSSITWMQQKVLSQCLERLWSLQGKALDLLVLSVFPFLNAPEHFSGCQTNTVIWYYYDCGLSETGEGPATVHFCLDSGAGSANSWICKQLDLQTAAQKQESL